MAPAELVAIALLLVLLAVAFSHPTDWWEGAVAIPCAALAVAVGAVSPDRAVDQLRDLAPVVAFLVAILLLAERCHAEGLFTAVGARLTLGRSGDAAGLLRVTFVVAAGTTAALSLDATAVLLTPVVVAAAARRGVSTRPYAYACQRLSNSASLLLPVSNLTNLLAGFAATSALGLHPAWAAAAGATALAARAVARREVGPGDLVRAAHLPFAAFVLGLGVVVAGVVDSGLGRWLGGLLPHGAALTDLLVIAGVAAVAAVAANLLNNLPATLLLVPLLAPSGAPALLAMLVGVNVGANATYPGSLANLLWRRALGRAGHPASMAEFHRLGLTTTPIVVAVATVTLWAWLRVLAQL